MASEARLLVRLLLFAVVALSAFRFAADVGAIAREPFADFPIFLRAAQRSRDGGELYEKKDDPAHYEPNAPVYKYPPLYAALLRPFCGDDPAAVARGHLALLLVLLAATVVLLVRQSAATASAAATATLLAVFHSGPLYETLRGLQLELPLLFLVALAAWAGVRGRERTLGAALGAAALLKIYPAFLLLPLIVARRWRALSAFAVVALLLGAAGLATAGVAENRFYWLDLLPRLLAELPARKLENVSLACLLMERGGLDASAAKQAARWIVLPLVALAIGALLRLRRVERDGGGDGGARDRTAGLDFAVAVPLMLLAIPNSWLNYQLLLLLPIATLLRLGLAPGAPRWPAFFALLAMVPLAFSGDSSLIARHAPWPDVFTLRMLELRLASPLLLLAAALACCARAQPAAPPRPATPR